MSTFISFLSLRCVQSYGGFLLHTCVCMDESDVLADLALGQKVEAKVDYARRR
jgi:hypothetical protein